MIFDNGLLYTKWLTYLLLCRGDYARYMRLRAAAVRVIASRGLYEQKYIRFLRTWIKPGDTVVDVGANLGAYSIAMAAAAGPSGKVLAFEPLEETYEGLRSNTSSWPQVTCFKIGLSDSAAPERKISVPLLFGRLPEPSLAGLDLSAAKYQTRLVRTATLDSYLEQIGTLSFVKIDVEGHELGVLRGARQTIGKFRPLIQIEASAPSRQFHEFCSFATSIGYQVCKLDKSGTLTTLLTADGTLSPCNLYLAPGLSRRVM